jgi:uncharacterized protein YjiS (DUF1127 family)
MSCGSTIGNSTNTLDPAPASFPNLKWSWNIPFGWLSGIALEWERRCQYGQLLALDDRLLADIGVSRTAIEEARRSPLYMTAWRDSR